MNNKYILNIMDKYEYMEYEFCVDDQVLEQLRLCFIELDNSKYLVSLDVLKKYYGKTEYKSRITNLFNNCKLVYIKSFSSIEFTNYLNAIETIRSMPNICNSLGMDKLVLEFFINNMYLENLENIYISSKLNYTIINTLGIDYKKCIGGLECKKEM